jgi:hypothetical protein
VFLALGVALAAFGVINAGAVASGTWSGQEAPTPVRVPRLSSSIE